MTSAWDRAELRDRVLGCLLGGMIGDALGAATETYTAAEIRERFGGLVRELRVPAADTPAAGNRAGQVTDDASQMLALAGALADSEGDLSVEGWREVLVRWVRESPERRMVGPTTQRILEGETGEGSGWRNASVGATNGAAMRVAPAGLVRPGDVDGAVVLAWVSARPTHDTQVGAAGAGAVAAGVAAAVVPGAGVLEVVRACRRGAAVGERLGMAEGREVPSASVARRIDLAVQAALPGDGLEAALESIAGTVGSSVMTVESVPAAVAVFLAAGAVPADTVALGASLGNDTDTVATMAGALAGALRGAAAWPAPLVDGVLTASTVDVEGLADRLAEIAWGRLR